MISGQETERVYSYNPAARTEHSVAAQLQLNQRVKECTVRL